MANVEWAAQQSWGMGHQYKRCPSHHQSKIQIRPHPQHGLHQRDLESTHQSRQGKRSLQSNSTGQKGGYGHPGVGEPTPAGTTTAESLLRQFRHGERIRNNRQQEHGHVKVQSQKRQEQQPPLDGQKDNAQAVAIPVHLSFPHSAIFNKTKQKQALIKERRRKKRRRMGSKSHRLQTLRQTRRQWLCARSAKEHHTQQMQLQHQVQRLKWVCDKVEIKYKEWDKFEH